jgi:c-di-GMP phosphodiesterase
MKEFSLVARQPIYDTGMAVVAYELLFRKSAVISTAEVENSRQATLLVIESALEIGLERLSGGLPVHINFPRELLVAKPPLSLPSEWVIEVLEDVPGDPEVIAAITALRASGHRIALDDYIPVVTDPVLLEVADIVKIVISQFAHHELASMVGTLKARGLELIAEEVETMEQFERCLQLGFSGFQGYFLQHPRTFHEKRRER